MCAKMFKNYVLPRQRPPMLPASGTLMFTWQCSPGNLPFGHATSPSAPDVFPHSSFPGKPFSHSGGNTAYFSTQVTWAAHRRLEDTVTKINSCVAFLDKLNDQWSPLAVSRIENITGKLSSVFVPARPAGCGLFPADQSLSEASSF